MLCDTGTIGVKDSPGGGNMVKDREFYKTILKIAMPSAFQSLISLAVTYLDDLMVSWIDKPEMLGLAADSRISDIGNLALTGVGQTNSLTSFFTAIVLGLTSGSGVLIAQYWGKKDLKRIKQVFPLVTLLTMCAALVFVLLSQICPAPLLRVVLSSSASSGDAFNIAVRYFSVAAFSYIPYALAYSMVGMLRAVEVVRVTLYITVGAMFVNLFFNYCLIFGRFGFPAMGVEGAAIATILARVAELAIVWYYTFRRQKAIEIKPKDLVRSPFTLWREYRLFGLPVGLGDAQWSLVGLFKSAIIGHLAVGVIAAYRAAEMMMSMGMIFTSALAAGACVIIGKTVGQKQYDKVREYSNTIQILFACFGVVMCVIIFLLRHVFISAYGLSGEAPAIAEKMIMLGAVTMLGTTYHASCFVGINRGAGDGKFVMYVDLICGWLVVLPLSYLAGYVWHVPPAFMFLFLRIDQCFKWLIAFIRLRGNKWIKNVTEQS